MRIRWRVVTFSLSGILLLGAIVVVVAVPYLHRLYFPTADFPPSVLARMGHPVHAILREDQQIDDFGAHIRSEANAEAYVKALVKRWLPNEANPHLAEFEDHLERAEYGAVRSPEKLIPEARIAETFNRLLDEWELPTWPRVRISELHAMRLLYAPDIYPNSVARLPDESIAPRCRPTEALFLLYVLDSNGGVPPEIREQVRDSRFPWRLLRQTKDLLSKPRPYPPNHGLYPKPWTGMGAIQFAYYDSCRARHLASHPFRFEDAANEILAQLGIVPSENSIQGFSVRM